VINLGEKEHLSQPCVELINVTCAYSSKIVLDGLNLQIARGQFVGLVGPSGAGKTTLLKALLGLVKPVSGMLLVKGVPVGSRPARSVAYVPQVEAVDWNFPVTVEQTVLMGSRASRTPWYTRAERDSACRIMERLSIAEYAHRPIRALSGGQQQRVFLARALAAQPDLLILDEPTAGIDMRVQHDILHLLTELNHAGLTILMSTHDLNAAAAHIPWLVCLNQKIVAQGTPETIFTPKTLNATYHGDMIVARQDGVIFVQERPHAHPWQRSVDVPAHRPSV